MQVVKALFQMKLANAEGTSEGMLCNDDDAANCPPADVFCNSSPLIQLKLYVPCLQAVCLLSVKIKLYWLIIQRSAVHANPF